MSFACKTATLKLPVTHSMGHGKGHFNLWGLRAVMLLRLRMTQSGCLKNKICQCTNVHRGYTSVSHDHLMHVCLQSLNGSWILKWHLPERLNASLRHCFLIPVECSCWSSRGLELPWPSLLPRRGLKADSQIRTLFIFPLQWRMFSSN